jgi:hypothetical protein
VKDGLGQNATGWVERFTRPLLEYANRWHGNHNGDMPWRNATYLEHAMIQGFGGCLEEWLHARRYKHHS